MKNSLRHSMVEHIYDELKQRFVSLDYELGQEILVEQLQKQFDTGPEPIRDAFSRLAKEGFVILTKAGGRVVTWEEDDIEEIQELSLALDYLALEDIFEQPDRSILLKELSIISERFVKAESPDDHARWAELFSKAMYRSTGSKRLLQMASSIKAQQAMLRNILLSRDETAPQLMEHQEIMLGIESDDLKATKRALEKSYQKKTRAILDVLAS